MLVFELVRVVSALRQAACLPAVPPAAGAAVRPVGVGRACQAALIAHVPGPFPPLPEPSFFEFGNLTPLLPGQVRRCAVCHDGRARAVGLQASMMIAFLC